MTGRLAPAPRSASSAVRARFASGGTGHGASRAASCQRYRGRGPDPGASSSGLLTRQVLGRTATASVGSFSGRFRSPATPRRRSCHTPSLRSVKVRTSKGGCDRDERERRPGTSRGRCVGYRVGLEPDPKERSSPLVSTRVRVPRRRHVASHLVQRRGVALHPHDARVSAERDVCHEAVNQMNTEQHNPGCEHEQVKIQVRDWHAEVDMGIAPLIAALWWRRIRTLWSCITECIRSLSIIRKSPRS